MNPVEKAEERLLSMVHVMPPLDELVGTPLRYRTFPVDPAAVGPARDFVAGALETPDLRELAGDARLIVSELATNAINTSHPGEEIGVGVIIDTEEVTLFCWDDHLTMPAMRDAGDLDDSGRGLSIVTGLSRSWGVLLLPFRSGKLVWATLGR